MARITVEDCLVRIPNLFQLVLVSAKRARQLANGAHAMVDWENDKPTVVALREIADGYVTEEILTQRDRLPRLPPIGPRHLERILTFRKPDPDAIGVRPTRAFLNDP